MANLPSSASYTRSSDSRAWRVGDRVRLAFTPSPPTVTLKFLGYTNSAITRVVLFEITNRSAVDLEWSLHVQCRPRDGYTVSVTEFMETNGVLTHVGGLAPMRLPQHNQPSMGEV